MNLIAAVDANWAIGYNNKLLVSIPDDMKFFRQETMGKVVVMTTQVTQEGSNMSVYEVGQKIKNAFGLIESYDMTLEATVTKLMWILGQTKDHDKVREMFYETINHDILWNTGRR